MKQWRATCRPIAGEVRSLPDGYDSRLGGASRDPRDSSILRPGGYRPPSASRNRPGFLDSSESKCSRLFNATDEKRVIFIREVVTNTTLVAVIFGDIIFQKSPRTRDVTFISTANATGFIIDSIAIWFRVSRITSP